MSTRRTRIAEIQERTFYQLPKFLVHHEDFKKMSGEAKILYSIMRDRQDLSIKNNWVNANGEVFIIYTRAEMMKDLSMSDKTITKCVNELKKYALIEEERQGLNKPNLIYVCTLDLESQWTRKNYESGLVKITSQDPQKLRPNYTNNNYTNLSDTNIQTQDVSLLIIFEYYRICFDRVPGETVEVYLAECSKSLETNLIKHAFDIAVEKNKKWLYTKGILDNWVKQGIKTLDQYKKTSTATTKLNLYAQMDSRDNIIDNLDQLEQQYIDHKLKAMQKSHENTPEQL